MKNEVTAYTGTFTTKGGNQRTMTFVRGDDIPTSIHGGGIKNNLEITPQEKGFRVDKNSRYFFGGWGEVSAKNINYSFDNRS